MVSYFNDSTTQDNVLENITSQFELNQIIKEPTHVLDHSYLCIDFIFRSKPNSITESGVHPYLHLNCHQLVYAKYNLQIYYPPQYYREVWHYKNANTELIRGTIDEFKCQKPFFNKNVNQKVDAFNKTILNILLRFSEQQKKKIPLIPPLFYENGFITDFKEKTELFNTFLLSTAPSKEMIVNCQPA